MVKNFKSNQKGLVGLLVIIAIIAVIVVAIVAWNLAYEVPTYQVTGNVINVKQVTVGDSSKSGLTWVVGIDDGHGGVRMLEIKNNLWHNVNTDTILMKIEAGHTYTFTCWGMEYTNTLFGTYWYPNIVGVTKIS
jgi:hypothetical protein